MPTASEIALVSGNPMFGGLIQAFTANLNALNAFQARELEGTRFTSLAIPEYGTGEFLDLNQGYTSQTYPFATGEFEASRIGAALNVPKSSTDLWNHENRKRIGAGITPDWFSLQMRLRMIGQLRHVQKQIFAGRTNDPKGFPGLKELTPSTTANTYGMTSVPQDDDFARSALNVGGAEATTATSVYSIATGPMDVELLMGGPTGVAGFLRMDEVIEHVVESGGRTQKYYYSEGEGYVGLSVMGSNEDAADRRFAQYSVRRAFNITAENDKTLTEKVLDRLISMHPPDHQPNMFVMSYRSQEQLRDSRTGQPYVVVGGPAQSGNFVLRPPLPTEHRGIPIVVTDAIPNNQAIETPA